MANYYCQSRTNYFRVKDEAAFREWANKWNLEIIESVKTGVTLFGLTPGDSDCGAFSLYDEAADEQLDVCDEIAAHLADDSIAVVLETGAEKLRYLIGWAVAINSSGDRVEMSLADIYAEATKRFTIEPTRAEY